MDSIKASFYFSDKKEESLFQFMKKKVEVEVEVAAAAASDGIQANIVVEAIDELSNNNQNDCLVVPFCTKNLDSFVGLKKAWEYRKKVDDYKTPFLFIIYTKLSLPDFLNPQTIESPSIKALLGNPSFGDVNKAVLMAESLIDADNKERKNFVLLSLTDNNFFQNFVHKVKWIEKYNNDEVEKIRKRFYHTFIDYYDYTVNGSPTKQKIEHLTVEDLSNLTTDDNAGKDSIDNLRIHAFTTVINKIKRDNRCNQLLKNDDCKIYDVLELADYIHRFLNGLPIPKKKGTHNIPLELFRAPVPFPLQQLVDAKNEISEELKKESMNKKIKLLLIDNRSDNKFISKNGDSPKPQSLCDLLFSENNGFDLGDIFEIHMLGNAVYKKKNGTPKFYQNDKEVSNYSNFKGEYEKFKFKRFKKPESLKEPEKEYRKEFILGKKNVNIKIDTYLDLVYQKVKDAHVVLLDFFLNEENTYLAFDFIKDMAEIKKQEGDSSTTWYFITSAVYDSVVKYSQSGLLAEYYESAVVCAGDDPTNNKRQIIFLYKLLTFINARLNSFKGYKDSIMKCRIFNNKACSHNNDCCRKPENCLFPVQSLCRKYTAEYNEITKIFPGTEEEEFKEIVELLENIITQFLWLPEADWHMIQRQIEFLDVMLQSKVPEKYKKHKFSCKYILEEMGRRSKIY